MGRETACPVCDADLLFAGDERAGDTVPCLHCGSPFLVTKEGKGDEDWEVEEDF